MMERDFSHLNSSNGKILPTFSVNQNYKGTVVSFFVAPHLYSNLQLNISYHFIEGLILHFS